MNMNGVQQFKDKISGSGIAIGSVVTLADPVVSELLTEVGYDFIWIDMEHSPICIETALHHVMAARGTATVPLVRVPWNDPVLIKRVLDLAPGGIIVPMINTGKQAESAVSACKYPPLGIRGFGPRRGTRYGGLNINDYLAEANNCILTIIQIEHIQAVNNIDEILAVSGIDAVCIGPNDLSGSLGKLGKVDDPEVELAINRVLESCSKSKIPAGVAAGYSREEAVKWFRKGIKWVCFNSDYYNLYGRSKQILNEARNAAQALS